MLLESLRCMRRTIKLMTSCLQYWCLHLRFGDITCMVFTQMCSQNIRALSMCSPRKS
ncbi:hypothetical protein MTR67_001531 [Solanum verrucosum]|uniref:Uncharacterized protein n=1 Tax=Solanum verrucosum TaxID=315347 RepID=A0AAF0PNY8_SOLVR|nr:hypothetical protein MTR67_001531 [Solanum verrucosum]